MLGVGSLGLQVVNKIIHVISVNNCFMWYYGFVLNKISDYIQNRRFRLRSTTEPPILSLAEMRSLSVVETRSLSVVEMLCFYI